MEDLERVFKEAFESHTDELFRHALLRLSNRDRALELTQETFLRALQYARQGQEIREMRAFLYRTLQHLIIDEYRKKKSTSLDAMLENEEGEEISSRALVDDVDALEGAMDRFDGARALSALKELPEPYREVIALRYVDGMTPKEIADILGTSQNVVSVRVYRGLRKLRELLESDITPMPE